MTDEAPVSSEYIGRLQKALIAADQAGNSADAYDLARALKQAMSRSYKESLQTFHGSEYNPDSPAYREKYGPTSGMGTGERLAAGAGKFFADLGRGVKQLTGNLSREEVDQLQAQDAPLMKTGAGMAGNIGGGIAVTAPLMFVPGANTYTGAALIGGGMGALKPVGTNDSRAFNVALGAGGGVVGKFAGDKIANWASRPVISPEMQQRIASNADVAARAEIGAGEATAQNTVTGAVETTGRGGGYTFGSVGDDAAAGLTASQRQMMERGQGLGFKLTPGQATGSRALQQMEAKLESQPMTSGPFNALKAENARALNRSFLKAIGEKGDDVSAEVLARADSRIGDVFESAARQNRTAYDDPLQQAFSDIEQSAGNELSSSEMGILRKQFDNVLKKASEGGGSLNGAQFQNIRQSLTRLSGNASSGVGFWARKIRDELDAALERSAGPEASKALQQAREQYRILATALNRTGAITPAGTVQPGLLANAISQSDKRGYLLGGNQSELYNALRFSQAFRPIVGDSGTATRMPLQGVTDFLTRVPLNIAARAYVSQPAVNVALRANAASGAASRLVQPMSDSLRRGLGSVPFYAPYELPVVGGLLGPYAAGK